MSATWEFGPFWVFSSASFTAAMLCRLSGMKLRHGQRKIYRPRLEQPVGSRRRQEFGFSDGFHRKEPRHRGRNAPRLQSMRASCVRDECVKRQGSGSTTMNWALEDSIGLVGAPNAAASFLPQRLGSDTVRHEPRSAFAPGGDAGAWQVRRERSSDASSVCRI